MNSYFDWDEFNGWQPPPAPAPALPPPATHYWPSIRVHLLYETYGCYCCDYKRELKQRVYRAVIWGNDVTTRQAKGLPEYDLVDLMDGGCYRIECKYNTCSGRRRGIRRIWVHALSISVPHGLRRLSHDVVVPEVLARLASPYADLVRRYAAAAGLPGAGQLPTTELPRVRWNSNSRSSLCLRVTLVSYAEAKAM
jgi:hypothetical protein